LRCAGEISSKLLLASWPLGVRAQQAGKQPTIGFLGSNEWHGVRGLLLLCSECVNSVGSRIAPIAIEYRWSEACPERVAEVAAEFVRLKVDVIVSYGTAVPALREATSTIPIVFAIAIDPAGAGIVPSLARPGGNVTGLSIEQTEAAGKRLELLRAVLPHLHRLAVIANVANPQTKQEIGAVQTAAQALGLELAPLEIRRAEDVATSLAALKGQADALHIAQDTLTNANRTQILTFALGVLGFQRSSVAATSLKRAPSCPMDQITQPCSDGRPNTWIKFCAEQSLAKFRSNNRPNSISSSTSLLRRQSD
jgi:putative tryptophan/tyrosine transport system substrate-binding protein